MSSNKSHEYDKEFGVDVPLPDALGRFVSVVKAEITEVDAVDFIPDGEQQIVPFKGKTVRKAFYNGEWWFSVVDVVSALTESGRARKYWADLKRQLADKEGFSEVSDKIGQLEMTAEDGKKRATDVATTETIFRIIQSITSPNAEPFKRWLAKVGYERIQENQNPEIAIKRAILAYQLQGRSDDWIEKRIRTIVSRKELTAEWKKRGVQNNEYAILTNVISELTFGMHAERHRRVKGLKKSHTLRDHMTDLELILTMLGETSTKEIARQRDAQGFYQNHDAAQSGGAIAGTARKQIEMQTGQPVVSSKNFLGSSKRTADPQRLTAAAQPV